MLQRVERHFAVLCVAVTVLGLLLPGLGLPGTEAVVAAAGRLTTLFLAGILFFTALKLDFAAAVREIRRPALLGFLAAVGLLAVPLAMWSAARWLAPEFALGVLILAAMPAGMATATLTDIVGGNASLAMMVTIVTSLACPLTVPLVIWLAVGGEAETAGFLLAQAGFLASMLLLPVTAAWAVRRAAPRFVARHRPKWRPLSIVSLALLILCAMAGVSADTLTMLAGDPWAVAGLMVFVVGLSAALHAGGYWVAFWRGRADRIAVSVTTAYVNNGLAVVFANTFFFGRFGPEAVLPAILLEIPMILAIPTLRAVLRRRAG